MSDALSAYVRLLFQAEPLKYSTTFINYSPFYRSLLLTPYGDVVHVSTPINAIQFDGNGDYLVPANYPLHPGASDFTLEVLYRPIALPASDNWPSAWSSCQSLMGWGSPSAADGCNMVLGATQLMSNNNDAKIAAGTHGMTTGNLYHLSMERYGTTITNRVDGVTVGTYTIGASAVGGGSGFYIGSETGQGAWLNGLIVAGRYTMGVARYKADFTPPASLEAPDPFYVKLRRHKTLNPWFGGDGHIVMPIDELGTPGAYRCDLYSAESRRLLSSKISGTDGALTWVGLDRGKKYFGVAHDPEQILRPGISDKFITPDKM